MSKKLSIENTVFDILVNMLKLQMKIHERQWWKNLKNLNNENHVWAAIREKGFWFGENNMTADHGQKIIKATGILVIMCMHSTLKLLLKWAMQYHICADCKKGITLLAFYLRIFAYMSNEWLFWIHLNIYEGDYMRFCNCSCIRKLF